jgi:hypothetical protein
MHLSCGASRRTKAESARRALVAEIAVGTSRALMDDFTALVRPAKAAAAG